MRWPQKLQGNGAVALDFSTVHHLMLSWLYNPLSPRSVVAPMPSRACVMVIGFYMHAYDPILIGLRTLEPVLYRGPEQPRDWHVLWHLPAVQVQRGLFGLWDVCMGTVIWHLGSNLSPSLVLILRRFDVAKCLMLPFFLFVRYVYVMADALFLNELLPFGSNYCPLWYIPFDIYS